MKINRDRRRIGLLFGGALLLLALAVPAVKPGGDGAPALETLDRLVSRWLDLRSTLAEEKRSWEAQRGQWEREIQWLTQEETALAEELDADQSFAAEVERERAAVLARQEKMAAERVRLRATLSQAEAALRKWERRVPAGLRPPLAALWRALPADAVAAEQRPVTQRAQTVLALYSQIETLQNQVSETQELLDGPDGRRLMEVFYLGLARGFAVSPTDDWAAVGQPTDQGWTWQSAPAAARAIRQALEMLRRERPPAMIGLPMQWSAKEMP